MTATKALGIVMMWAAAFAVVGGALGACLGLAAPDYYRAMLRVPETSSANPVQIGIGLGVTQGFAFGTAIALVLIVLLIWRDVRSKGSAPKIP